MTRPTAGYADTLNPPAPGAQDAAARLAAQQASATRGEDHGGSDCLLGLAETVRREAGLA